jgi:hypothetical protein
MTTVPFLDGLSNVVTTVRWQLIATDANTGAIAQCSRVNVLGPPNPADYTAYPDLTEAQVLSWIPDYSQDPTILAELTASINAQNDPASVPAFPPWGTP